MTETVRPGCCMKHLLAAKSKLVPISLKLTTVFKDLLEQWFAVSFTTVPEELIATSVVSFVLVTDVNVENPKITLLSPQPMPLLDRCLLLMSNIMHVDTRQKLILQNCVQFWTLITEVGYQKSSTSKLTDDTNVYSGNNRIGYSYGNNLDS